MQLLAELTFSGCIILEQLVVVVDSTWTPLVTDLLTNEQAMKRFLELPDIGNEEKRQNWEKKTGKKWTEYRDLMLADLQARHLHAGNINTIGHELIASTNFLDVADDLFAEIFDDPDNLSTDTQEHRERMTEYVERCVEAAKKVFQLPCPEDDCQWRRQFLSKLRLMLGRGQPLLTKSHLEMINATLDKYPEAIKEVSPTRIADGLVLRGLSLNGIVQR